MQTAFTLTQLADPHIKTSDQILRSCVHCGFCTATCPTYVLLGDELDSPRGRIYLIKEMLEHGGAPSSSTVTHIDRCLSCLSCMTTCPSGVHYMHLVDHARAYIFKTFTRPWIDRFLRWGLSYTLQRPRVMRAAMRLAQVFRFSKIFLPKKFYPLFDLTPSTRPSTQAPLKPQIFPAQRTRQRRVALLTGCAQTVLAPEINEATIRLLTRHGCDVVITTAGCCGALSHHLGNTPASHKSAAEVITAFNREIDGDGLDAIVINTSGCGTTIKDYGFMFRHDPKLAPLASRVSALAKDISEIMDEIGLRIGDAKPALTVAYHSACSMQHGQKINDPPRRLLKAAGFTVMEIPEGHLCCGSAGTYNLLQPDIANRLRDRKRAHIENLAPDLVATGNIGCMTQLGLGTSIPIVHTAALLDWVTGGPKPAALSSL